MQLGARHDNECGQLSSGLRAGSPAREAKRPISYLKSGSRHEGGRIMIRDNF